MSGSLFEADLFNFSQPLFGGTAGAGGLGAAANQDIGFGAGNFTPDIADPTSNPNSWWNRNFTNDNLQKALTGLGQVNKDAQAAAAGKGAGPAGSMGGGSSAGVGRGGGGGVSLDAIVQMLAAKQQALMKSATGGVGAGQPPKASTSGLLGL